MDPENHERNTMTSATDIMKEAIELKERKSADYQGSQFTEADYFPYDDKSYITMLWTKMLRIRSVAEQDNPNFESVEDSLIDMINYAAMYAAYLRKQKQAPLAAHRIEPHEDLDRLRGRQPRNSVTYRG